MPILLRTKRNVKDSPRQLQVVEQEDIDQIIFSNSQSEGFRELLRIPTEKCVQMAILIGTVLATTCVIIDFTLNYTSKERTAENDRSIRALCREFIFCFDCIFFAEVMASIARRKAKVKPHNNALLITIEVISLIPFEMIYATSNGRALQAYYIMRFRYWLRIIRYLIVTTFSMKPFSISLTLIKYTIFGCMVCMMGTCFRIILNCNLIASFKSTFTCQDLNSFDFTLSYAILSGQFGVSGSFFKGVPLAPMFVVVGGFFHVFALCSTCFMIPRTVCIFLRNHASKFDYAVVANIILQNMSELKVLKGETWTFKDDGLMTHMRSYLAAYWKYWRLEVNHLDDLEDFRVARLTDIIHKEIALDRCWNMYAHSMLFKNEDVAFLRRLANVTRFHFCIKGENLYGIEEFRSSMIYLVNGIISLKPMNNLVSASISLSGGTVFGELQLFVSTPVRAAIFCKKNCEFLILDRVQFLQIKAIYPEIYRRLRQRILNRLLEAKRYHYVGQKMFEDKTVKRKKSELSMRYIKQTIRSYTNKEHFRKLNHMENMSSPYTFSNSYAVDKTVFNAEYLPMYVLDHEMELSLTSHVLVTGWRFKLNPRSSLVDLWALFIYLLVFILNLYFPIGVTLEADLFTTTYDYFIIVITVFWIIDFATYGYIGDEKHGSLITNSEQLFMLRIESVTFWLDLVSAVPLELIMHILQGPLGPFTYRMLGCNRLLKLYKFNFVLSERLAFRTKHFLIFEVFKLLYALFFLILTGFAVFYRFGYFDQLKEMTGFGIRLCVVSQFFFSTGDRLFFVQKNSYNLIPLIILQWVNFYTIYFIYSYIIGAVSLCHTKIIRYENMIDDVKKIFTLYKFVPSARRKLHKYMHLHYDFGKGDMLVDQNIVKKMIGGDLFKIKRYMLHEHIFETEGLFTFVPKAVLKDMSEIGKMTFVPKNELIIIAGSIVRDIYVIINGQCGYVYENLNICQVLNPGQSFLVLEALCGVNAINNVMALTDCKLLCIPYNQLNRKIIKYPKEFRLIQESLADVVNVDKLIKMTCKEAYAYCTTDMNESCRYFNMRKTEFITGFGKFTFLRHIFMRTTITPHGRFWLCWELSYILCVYLYTFVGTVPIAINTDYRSGWFWLFRLVDLILLIDIYLRHHVVYYNSMKVEVQHPWQTAKHYWKTSFLIDFIGFFPIEFIVIPLTTRISTESLCAVRFNKLILLYRIVGVRKFINSYYMMEHLSTMMVYFITSSLLLIHIFVIELLFYDCTIIFDKGVQVDLCTKTPLQFWREYGNRFRVAMLKFFCMGFYEREALPMELWRYTIITVIGFVMMILQLSVVTAICLSRNSYLTLYQIKMQRLVRFMSLEKFDVNMKKEIIKHYEYLWNLRQGKNLKHSLKKFSKTAYEDLLYYYYAPTVQDTILFHGFPRVVLKEIISSEHLLRVAMLITGIPLRVNDVQGNIFIIYKGEVQVMGPDYSYLRKLRKGSIFGCLDRVEMHRATLTYVAKTHCEFLVIKSLVFHEILSKYPRFYKHYLFLLDSTNIDYIPSLPLPEDLKKKSRWRDFQITNKRLSKLLRVLPIIKPNEKRTLFIAIYCFVAFIFECCQLTLFKILERKDITIYLAYILDFIFWVKIYLEFFTAYEDATGILVYKRRLIAWRYLRSALAFAFDLFCNFPFEVVVFFFDHPSILLFWSFGRVNRLLKIVLVFRYVSSVRNRLNINVTLFRTTYILLVSITVQQICGIFIQHFVYAQTAQPATAKTTSKSMTIFHSYWRTILVHSYFVSSRLFAPFGLRPMTIEDGYIICLPFIILVARFTTIYIMAECVSAYQVFKFSDFGLAMFVRKLEEKLTGMNISPSLMERVNLYCRNMAARKIAVQFPRFIRNAPYYLREGVMDCMFGVHLRRHPVLRRCHVDLVRQIGATFSSAHFFRGDFVSFRNDIDGCLYFLHEGEVEGLVQDELHYDVADCKFLPGDSFGFKQMVLPNVGHYRTYKVTSEWALILFLQGKYVLPLLDFFPASKHLILSCVDEYDELNNADMELRDYLIYTHLKHK